MPSHTRMPVSYRMTFALGATLFCASAVLAQAQPRPLVIELYTSEGCSSCPPAEAYIGELARRPDVLALAFHVDYWDDLGWRDRFALAAATQRQRAYAKGLRLRTVYTPQLIIDGREDRVGSNRLDVGRAVAGSRTGAPVAIRVEMGRVVVELGAQDGAAPADVLLVPYRRRAVSAIGRGENAGRTLQEFNIVRSLTVLGRWEGRAHTFQTALSAIPVDATDVAVLVQAAGPGAILGAATHPLR